MRGTARSLLLILAFSIPWEYSLDFGPPFGNVSRIVALTVLLAFIPTLFLAGGFRRPAPLLWLVLALLVWSGFSCLWSMDPDESLRHLRGTTQELMIVWFIWELVDTVDDLRNLMLACVCGASVLALLTIRNYLFAAAAEQVRFVAEGQDPNDVARYLVLALPLAALLLVSRGRCFVQCISGGYLALGIVAVMLTGSRSGSVSALIAFAGCAQILFQRHRRAFTYGLYALPVFLAVVWFAIPLQTLERIATISTELQGGDLNQRANIWAAGWLAFKQAPLLGTGVGSFVAAAGVAPIDTAHNTPLGFAVEGGIIALILAAAIVALNAACVMRLRGGLRIAMGSSLAALLLSSLVATVQENRMTWFLLSLIAVAARLSAEPPISLAGVFQQRDYDTQVPLIPEPRGHA